MIFLASIDCLTYAALFPQARCQNRDCVCDECKTECGQCSDYAIWNGGIDIFQWTRKRGPIGWRKLPGRS